MLLSLNKYLTKSFGSPWVTHRFSQNFFLRALRVSSVRVVSKKGHGVHEDFHGEHGDSSK